MAVRHARVACCVCLFLLIASAGAAAQLPAPGRIGGSVDVLAVWGGSELDSFRAMVKPFEEKTGVSVRYEGTRDLNAVLTTRLKGGHPPDLAALPGPGQIAELARTGSLRPLDDALDMGQMKAEYAPTWLDLASAGGRPYSIFIKTALKGLIWYDPKTFRAARYQVPRTWDEVRSLTQRLAASGKRAWCIGLESGAASGWPATDWIEIVLLRSAGPQVYERWYQHTIPWTDPVIRKAWETFGRIATDPKAVYGGREAVLSTNFAEAVFPMFASPPGCYLHLGATFVQGFIQQQFPRLKPGEDYDFVPFPAISPGQGTSIEIAGDLVGMFRDTPQSRALIRYLATADAQAIWVRRGGALSPNHRVTPADYPDPLSRRAAALLRSSRIARFDASDMMPQSVQDAFYQATLEYVHDPRRLSELLVRVEQAAREAVR